MIELREYQHSLLGQVEKSLVAENARVMMQLPTGAGKTVIAAHFLRNRLANGRKAVWITHRIELALQTRNMLRSSAGVNVSPQASWARSSPAPHLPNGVVIVMAQTASRRAVESRIWEHYDDEDFLVVDEAHHATARGWERIIRGWPGRVLGMTATPWRLSVQEGFDHIFRYLVCGPQVQELQTQDFLCDATVVVPPDDELIKGGEVGAIGDYTERGIERANLPDVMTANALRFWWEQTPNRQTIVYAVSVDHARNLAAVFNDANVPAEVMLGETPSNERASMITDFEAGRLQVLINVAVATEGFDLPDASCVMIARPTTSLSLYLQMVGRGLRPKPNGGNCVILDLAGNAMTHGLPEDYREWSLSARGVEGDGEAPVIRCKRCYTVSPAASHKCKNCDDPFGEMCGRCGRWRSWKRWSLVSRIRAENGPGAFGWALKNKPGCIHDLVCDLCHMDAHVQANLPVSDEMSGLAGWEEYSSELEEDDMSNDYDELDERLSQILRELLEDERERAMLPYKAKRDELMRKIPKLDNDMRDDEIWESRFQEYLGTLPLDRKPTTKIQERRIFMEWEGNLRTELASLRSELANLEMPMIDHHVVLDKVRNRIDRGFKSVFGNAKWQADAVSNTQQTTSDVSLEKARKLIVADLASNTQQTISDVSSVSVSDINNQQSDRKQTDNRLHLDAYTRPIFIALQRMGGAGQEWKVLESMGEILESQFLSGDLEWYSPQAWHNQARLQYHKLKMDGYFDVDAPADIWRFTSRGRARARRVEQGLE